MHQLLCCRPTCIAKPSHLAAGLVISPLQAAWKLLGDALLQHSRTTPHTLLHVPHAGLLQPESPVEWVVAVLRARLDHVQQASQAYCCALRLEPTQGEMHI